MIPPRSLTLIPASLAIEVSGFTPIDSIIRSVSISIPLDSTTFLPLFLNSLTPSFKIRLTPLSINTS